MSEDNRIEDTKVWRMKARKAMMESLKPDKAKVIAKMSEGNTKELDMAEMEDAGVQYGTVWPSTRTFSPVMKPFLSHTRDRDGVDLIDLEKTWERLVMASMTIAAIDNPCRILVASFDGRAVRFLEEYIKVRALNGEHPVTAENTRLLILTYPKNDEADHKRLLEEAYAAGIPMIAFCQVDCPMDFVDHDKALIVPAYCDSDTMFRLFQLLTRMVLQIRGAISLGHKPSLILEGYLNRKLETTINQHYYKSINQRC